MEAGWIATFCFVLHKTIGLIILLSHGVGGDKHDLVAQRSSGNRKTEAADIKSHLSHRQSRFRCIVLTSIPVFLPSALSSFRSSPLHCVVCVMDGLLYHMSNTNIGLSACAGSSLGKLNLSQAFFLPALLHSLPHLYSQCVSKSV